MYNSIRGMLRFLSPERKKVTYIYYEDYAKELDQESYHLTVTHNLLNHSLRDISLLKEDFKNKFMVYQYHQKQKNNEYVKKIEKYED